MYKKILAAVNEHLNSEACARYAMQLAKVTDGKLYICFVAEKGTDEKTLGHAEETVKRLFYRAKDLNVKVESILDSGDPVIKIRDFVNSEHIDIAFAATRQEDVKKRFYAGTMARRLSVNLSCSVALVRVVHMGRIHPKQILAPLKEKIDHTKERAYFTAKLAEGFGSKIFVFHAARPITKFFHGEIHLTPVEWERRSSREIAGFIDHLNKYAVAFERKFTPGKTAKSITLEAAAKRHDLIIMGASERSLLSSLIKGNPVEEVLRETPCDLIILRPRHENT